MRRFQVRLNLLITQPDIFYNSPLLPGCNRNPGDCGRTPPGHLGQHVRAQQLEAWSPGKAFGRGRRYGQFPVEYIRAPTRSRQYVRRSVSQSQISLILFCICHYQFPLFLLDIWFDFHSKNTDRWRSDHERKRLILPKLESSIPLSSPN